MPVQIENVTNRPVLLRLNSGATLHLAPRSISSEILEVEVSDNAKVQKLVERSVIQLQAKEKMEAPAQAAEKSKPHSGKGKK